MANHDNTLVQAATGLAVVLGDYRITNGFTPLNAESVLNWVNQFEAPQAAQSVFLKELTAIYSKTYCSEATVRARLRGIAMQQAFTGKDPVAFWSNIDVLDIQTPGRSQADLRFILADEIRLLFGVEVTSHTRPDRHSLYLDDAVFSGNTVVNQVRIWLGTSPPPVAFTIVALDVSTAGEYSLKQRLNSEFGLHPKVWAFKRTENRRNYGGETDVLRLRAYPNDQPSQTYLNDHLEGGPPALLRGDQLNSSKIFTNEASRVLLESMFWSAGLNCLAMCPDMSANVRPLGYCSSGGQNKLGFGSLFASYRNCPNNAPVALWANNPWTPLLPRKTNR